jgi:hypothetical protein
MSQQSANVSNNYLTPANNERLQFLNAQQAYHYPQQPSLSLTTRGLPVNPYYPGEAPYDNDSQADNYMLSPATPMAQHDAYAVYGLPDGGRSWSASNNRYNMCYPRYSEHDSATYAYDTGHQHRRPAVSDSSGGSFSTSALQTSLPPQGGRVLPPPNAGARTQLQAHPYDIPQMRANTSTGVATNVPLPTYSKSTQGWAIDQATSGARNDSIASSRSGDIAAPTPLKPHTASSASSGDSTLTLLSSSGADADISTTGAASIQSVNIDSGVSTRDGLGITNSQHPMYAMPTGSASETRLRHNGPGFCQSTFSIERRQQSRSELTTNEDRYIGSTPYVPLQYPPEQGNPIASTSSIRHGSAAGRINGLPHRSSMPVLNQES